MDVISYRNCTFASDGCFEFSRNFRLFTPIVVASFLGPHSQLAAFSVGFNSSKAENKPFPIFMKSFLDLPRGAEWMVRGVNSPSFRIKQHPLEDAGWFL